MPILHAPSIRTLFVAAFACSLAGLVLDVHAQDTAPDSNAVSAPISTKDVDEAIAKVKVDPNLAQERKISTLRWRGDDNEEEQDKPKRESGRFGWIGDFFAFIAQSGQVIVWLAVIAAVGLLVVLIVRLVRDIAPASRAERFVAPTHVRDLDIRPESLPADIGAAVSALWENGSHREALALLYRGLLSRLAHVHAVPIRHSSTEGDCLALATHHLQPDRAPYVARVIRVWQHAVYGAQLPASTDMQLICSEFAGALAKPLHTLSSP